MMDCGMMWVEGREYYYQQIDGDINAHYWSF